MCNGLPDHGVHPPNTSSANSSKRGSGRNGSTHRPSLRNEIEVDPISTHSRSFTIARSYSITTPTSFTGPVAKSSAMCVRVSFVRRTTFSTASQTIRHPNFPTGSCASHRLPTLISGISCRLSNTHWKNSGGTIAQWPPRCGSYLTSVAMWWTRMSSRRRPFGGSRGIPRGPFTAHLRRESMEQPTWKTCSSAGQIRDLSVS